MNARSLAVYLLLFAVPSFAQQSANPPELISMFQKAQGLIGLGKTAEAESVMLEASKKFPDKPAAWYLLGYSRHAQKKYDDAMAAYKRANKLAQGRAPNTLYNMACIHAIRKDNDKAFEALDAALKAGFREHQFHSLRSRTRQSEGRQAARQVQSQMAYRRRTLR